MITVRRQLIVASTLYGEARSELSKGMAGVAWVIVNRVADKRWPDDAAQVCLQQEQFSCWNENNKNFRAMLLEDNDTFNLAYHIAGRAYSRLLAPDPTGGANHYHDDSVKPYWTENKTPTATIGRLIFYRL